MGLDKTPRTIKHRTSPPSRTIQGKVRTHLNARTHPNARTRTTRGLRVAGGVAGPAKAEIVVKVGVARGTGAGGAVGAHATRRVAPVATTATAKMMADRSRSN